LHYNSTTTGTGGCYSTATKDRRIEGLVQRYGGPGSAYWDNTSLRYGRVPVDLDSWQYIFRHFQKIRLQLTKHGWHWHISQGKNNTYHVEYGRHWRTMRSDSEYWSSCWHVYIYLAMPKMHTVPAQPSQLRTKLTSQAMARFKTAPQLLQDWEPPTDNHYPVLYLSFYLI